MSTPVEVPIGTYSRLRFTYRTISPDVYSIYPRLRIDLDVAHTVVGGAPSPVYNIAITDANMDLKIRDKDGIYHYIGTLTPTQIFFNLSPGGSMILNSFLNLDHYGLSQIEKLRENKDIMLSIDTRFIAELQQQPPVRSPQSFTLELRVPKSDWVETILPSLKYKDVMLIEIPKLADTEFTEIVNYLNGAWKQYSMGEYDKVLSECRKALEALNGKLRSKGFEKEVANEKGTKRVPDWSKLLGNQELGEIIGIINQKMWGFVTPGAHAGKAINKEDADFSLMTIYALINLAIKKLSL